MTAVQQCSPVGGSRFSDYLQRCRASRRLVLVIVAIALLLDNMLLTTVGESRACFSPTRVTHSVELSPCWEANSCSATQEILSILWNLKVHNRVHKSPPMVSIRCQMNPLHTLPSSIHFNMLPFSSSFFLWFLSSGFPTKTWYAVLSPACYVPCPSRPPLLVHSNNIGRRIRLWIFCYRSEIIFHFCPEDRGSRFFWKFTILHVKYSYLWGNIINRWLRHHHQKVTRFYFQHKMATRIALHSVITRKTTAETSLHCLEKFLLFIVRFMRNPHAHCVGKVQSFWRRTSSFPALGRG
jgi:hypothetical protein